MSFPLLPSPWMTDEHQMLAEMTHAAPAGWQWRRQARVRTDQEIIVSGTPCPGVGPGVSHPRTPVEYLWQDDGAGQRPCTPLPACAVSRAGGSPAGRGGITLHGHRLSSLYRGTSLARARLRRRERAPSSCLKYSPFYPSTLAPTERTRA